MSAHTPLRNRLDQPSSGDLRTFKHTKTVSLSMSPLLANRPVYSTPQPLGTEDGSSTYVTPVKTVSTFQDIFPKTNNQNTSLLQQTNKLNSESKLDSSRALLLRVENALRKSQSMTPAKLGTSQIGDTFKFDIQNQPLKESLITNLSISSPTPSYRYNDFIKLKASTATAQDSKDVWREKYDEKVNVLKSESESIKKIYEDLLRDGRHARSNSMNLLQPSIQTCVNKNSSVAQVETRLKDRDYGLSEINALKSGLNNIEGQLNALESLSSSGMMSKTLSANLLSSAPRSQSCISRKSSAFEKEESSNYASMAFLKDSTPPFFGASNRKGSSIPITVVDLSNQKSDISFQSKMSNNLDLSMNNLDFLTKNFESPNPSRSRLNSHQSYGSTASRTTKGSNMPVRVTYQSSGFDRNNREGQLLKSTEMLNDRVQTLPSDKDFGNLSGSVNVSHHRSSSHYNSNTDNTETKRMKAEPFHRDYTEIDRNVLTSNDNGINKVHPERPLQAFPNSILKKSVRPSEKEQNLRNYKITYTDEKDELEESIRTEKKVKNIQVNLTKSPLNSEDVNLDLSPMSGDKKMKKLILRTKSIEDIDKKDSVGLLKTNSQSKNPNEQIEKVTEQAEAMKKIQDSKPSSQVTFRPMETGLNSNSSKIAQKNSREIIDDGRAWNMKKLPNSIFEDTEQPFDFGSEAPRMSPPTKTREKIAARLPHSRSYSGSHNYSRPKNLIFPTENSSGNTNNIRTTLVNKPRLSENPKKKPVFANFTGN